MSRPESLYESDFYAWTQDQAAKLRAMLEARANSELDLENLAEEIESVGRSDKRELNSRLARIVEHLLKLEGSTLWEPREQWKQSVRKQRLSLYRLLDDSPSLRREIPEELTSAYAWVKRRLEFNLIELTMDIPPDECPFTPEQVLDENWLPFPQDR